MKIRVFLLNKAKRICCYYLTTATGSALSGVLSLFRLSNLNMQL